MSNNSQKSETPYKGNELTRPSTQQPQSSQMQQGQSLKPQTEEQQLPENFTEKLNACLSDILCRFISKEDLSDLKETINRAVAKHFNLQSKKRKILLSTDNETSSESSAEDSESMEISEAVKPKQKKKASKKSEKKPKKG